eukprot:scaffold2503_cov301-Prasinococcus_capsulatus_cf.AAC.5
MGNLLEMHYVGKVHDAVEHLHHVTQKAGCHLEGEQVYNGSNKACRDAKPVAPVKCADEVLHGFP